MKTTFKQIGFALGTCAILSFSSCEKMVLEDNEDVPEAAEALSNLTITTRSGDDADEWGGQTRVYIFNQEGECVQTLDTDGEENTATVQLASDTYTLYAVGSDDLERFTLPTLSEATPTSVITLQDGKVMDSFFCKQMTITLSNGENQNLKIALDRKVFCLNKIEIKDVPTEVTAVEVALSAFYSAIQLDGTLLSSSTTDYKTTLTKQSDETTWQAVPNQLFFPSKGEPKVNISFTTSKGLEQYNYTLPEAFEANHYYNICGNYKWSKAQMNVTVTVTGWDDERDLDFDFSEENRPPKTGEYYKGYYTVSVNEQERTAVLLSEKVPFDAPADAKNASVWKAELEKQMAALEKPTNTPNGWRLPTVAEVEIFTRDPQAVSFSEKGLSPICFCLDEKGNLAWAYTEKQENGGYTFTKSGSDPVFTSDLRLRPVFDITY